MIKQLLFGFCLIILLGCAGLPSQTEANTVVILPTQVNVATPSRKPQPGIVNDRLNPLASDQTIVIPNWQLNIRSVLRGEQAEQLIRETNSFNSAAETGYQHLIIELQITPLQPQPVTEVPIIRLTGDQLTLYNTVPQVLPMSYFFDQQITEQTIAQVAFHIPADETNLQLVVSSDYVSRPVFVAIDPLASIQPDANLYLLTPNQLGTSPSKPAAFGQTVVTNEWELRLIEHVRGEQALAMLLAANQFNDLPPSNAEYILFKVQLRSLQHQDLDQANNTMFLSFQVQGESQTMLQQPSVVVPNPKLSDAMYAGGQTQGWRAYLIPKGEQNLQLVFQSDSFGDTDIRYLAFH